MSEAMPESASESTPEQTENLPTDEDGEQPEQLAAWTDDSE